ncbi:alpha-L-glutamate ligase [Streptomyces sp. NPDC047000]|uniref:ATP-grasp domain-containing protein n=1 Tax=Streptomyces sp. NPDC047000 TaxID=3155474 RepID=UPI0033C73698
MRIGLITSQPGHPLLAATTALLAARHRVDWIDPRDPAGPDVLGTPADVYLLKARTAPALALAGALEERGAPVLNSSSATALCQDRTLMAERAVSAGLPFVGNRTVARLRHLADEPGLSYPLVVKSRHSRRGDLVARVDGPGRLRELCGRWADEPVVVQPYTANDGWDRKLWVIGGKVFAALRRSELADDPAAGLETVSLPLRELPQPWLETAAQVGPLFGLEVYGVDLIDAGGNTPQIVDVNAFPGARGQAGAPEALTALALRTAEGNGWTGRAGGQPDRRSPESPVTVRGEPDGVPGPRPGPGLPVPLPAAARAPRAGRAG